jgi:hypothetical protein
MGGRVVCYSFSPPRDRGYRTLLLSQLVASARTLRSHTAAIPARVFWVGAGPVDPITARRLRELDVQVVRGPGYDRLLATVPGAELLVGYPVLQKYFAPEALLAQEPWSQVLLLDCDTLFLGDVERLFDRYAEAGVVAAPDAGTSRRGRGYDPAYLDEERVRELAGSLGARHVPPVNGGVLLLGERALQQQGELRGRIVELTLPDVSSALRWEGRSHHVSIARRRTRCASGCSSCSPRPAPACLCSSRPASRPRRRPAARRTPARIPASC